METRIRKDQITSGNAAQHQVLASDGSGNMVFETPSGVNLSAYLDKATYDTNYDGKVNDSDKIDGVELTKLFGSHLYDTNPTVADMNMASAPGWGHLDPETPVGNGPHGYDSYSYPENTFFVVYALPDASSVFQLFIWGGDVYSRTLISYDWSAWEPFGGGVGDMLKSAYDTDNDGIVDNSEALEGHTSSYFAQSSHSHDAPNSEAIFTVADTVLAAAGSLRIYNATGVTKTITKVFLGINTAPTGAAVIVDIHKNGTTIFTTQANRPQIAISANTGDSTSIDVTSWADGEYLTADVDQVGSTIAGSDLTIHIVYH